MLCVISNFKAVAVHWYFDVYGQMAPSSRAVLFRKRFEIWVFVYAEARWVIWSELAAHELCALLAERATG